MIHPLTIEWNNSWENFYFYHLSLLFLFTFLFHQKETDINIYYFYLSYVDSANGLSCNTYDICNSNGIR